MLSNKPVSSKTIVPQNMKRTVDWKIFQLQSALISIDTDSYSDSNNDINNNCSLVDVFEESKLWFTRSIYEEVIEERVNDDRCGYPLCSNNLTTATGRKGLFRISYNEKKIYEIEQSGNYCCSRCQQLNLDYISCLDVTMPYSREVVKTLDYNSAKIEYPNIDDVLIALDPTRRGQSSINSTASSATNSDTNTVTNSVTNSATNSTTNSVSRTTTDSKKDADKQKGVNNNEIDNNKYVHRQSGIVEKIDAQPLPLYHNDTLSTTGAINVNFRAGLPISTVANGNNAAADKDNKSDNSVGTTLNNNSSTASAVDAKVTLEKLSNDLETQTNNNNKKKSMTRMTQMQQNSGDSNNNKLSEACLTEIFNDMKMSEAKKVKEIENIIDWKVPNNESSKKSVTFADQTKQDITPNVSTANSNTSTLPTKKVVKNYKPLPKKPTTMTSVVERPDAVPMSASALLLKKEVEDHKQNRYGDKINHNSEHASDSLSDYAEWMTNDDEIGSHSNSNSKKNGGRSYQFSARDMLMKASVNSGSRSSLESDEIRKRAARSSGIKQFQEKTGRNKFFPAPAEDRVNPKVEKDNPQPSKVNGDVKLVDYEATSDDLNIPLPPNKDVQSQSLEQAQAIEGYIPLIERVQLAPATFYQNLSYNPFYPEGSAIPTRSNDNPHTAVQEGKEGSNQDNVDENVEDGSLLESDADTDEGFEDSDGPVSNSQLSLYLQIWTVLDNFFSLMRSSEVFGDVVAIDSSNRTGVVTDATARDALITSLKRGINAAENYFELSYYCPPTEMKKYRETKNKLLASINNFIPMSQLNHSGWAFIGILIVDAIIRKKHILMKVNYFTESKSGYNDSDDVDVVLPNEKEWTAKVEAEVTRILGGEHVVSSLLRPDDISVLRTYF